jgi:peptidoglycan hydrolase-like protein with peptidoglycan-binding domain
MIEELKARLQGLAAAYKAIKTAVPVVAAAATKISDSVGDGGKNNPADVKLVQQLLNKNHGQSLTADGDCGAKTIAAIKDFQAKKLGSANPDGRVDAGGKTWTALSTNAAAVTPTDSTTPTNTTTPPSKDGVAPASSYYSHPKANDVKLGKGKNAVQLNGAAEMLLKSLLAGSGNMTANYTSTLRTYVDQARAMFGNKQSQIEEWYGNSAPKAPAAFKAFKAKGDQAGFAKWLEAYDKERGKIISNHLPGIAIDVIGINHSAFQKFVTGKAGVKKFLDEPKIGVTHIEFMFKVTGGSASAGGGSTEIPVTVAAPVNGETPAASVGGSISQSVGDGGKNVKADVILVQNLLNKNHGQKLTADGDCGAKTITAIKDFQSKKVGLATPDGRIDPGGKTWTALSTGNATPNIPEVPKTNGELPIVGGDVVDLKGEYAKLAAQYGLEQAVIYTIQAVESGGKGYLPDGRAKILFEGHVFWKELVKIGKDPNKLVKGNENVLYPKWVKTHYVGGAGEYDRLAKAQKIDSTAALKSASWGEFQIMGNNHKTVGYSTVEEFVEAMKVPGTNNVKALLEFCKNNKLLKFVNGPSKDWAGFARGYNGPGYATNKYDTKLAAAYAKFKVQYPEAPPMA